MKITRHPPVVKKALLVGISYRDSEASARLPATISDVNKFRGLLIDKYDYRPQDIVVMTDEDGVVPRMKPTKINLLREIAALVAHAVDGNHFLFYFSGHSSPVKCNSGTEDDGQDETLLCSDHDMIKDNTLHKILVKGLPTGASLTAIFDCCNSGTLLDLEHYICNDVYVPWINKGQRKSATLQNVTSRKNALPNLSTNSGALADSIGSELKLASVLVSSTALESVSSARSFRTKSGEDLSVEVVFTVSAYQSMDKVLGSIVPSNGTNNPNLGDNFSSQPIAAIRKYFPDEDESYIPHQCSSPEPMYSSCQGNCREEIKHHAPQPLIVSISSSKDSQVTWDDTGSSMTLSLIKILEKTPAPSYRHLMTELKFAIHASAREMHQHAKELHKRNKGKTPDGIESKDFKVEMNEFQEPQLGSMIPLNMEDSFIL